MKTQFRAGRWLGLAALTAATLMAGAAHGKEKMTYAYLADPALEGVLYAIKNGKVTSDTIEIEASALQIPEMRETARMMRRKFSGSWKGRDRASSPN